MGRTPRLGSHSVVSSLAMHFFFFSETVIESTTKVKYIYLHGLLKSWKIIEFYYFKILSSTNVIIWISCEQDSSWS